MADNQLLDYDELRTAFLTWLFQMATNPTKAEGLDHLVEATRPSGTRAGDTHDWW